MHLLHMSINGITHEHITPNQYKIILNIYEHTNTKSSTHRILTFIMSIYQPMNKMLILIFTTDSGLISFNCKLDMFMTFKCPYNFIEMHLTMLHYQINHHRLPMFT